MGSMKKRGIIIRTDALTKIYGKTIVAVSRLNLEIREGEIFGLL
jgi:ABC-type multidrug transport system ATPase subunit